MEYGEVIARMAELSTQIADARSREEYREAMALADQIGDLYSPDDHIQASRIAFLVNHLGSANYWAGVTQIQAEHRIEQAKAFSPPF